jgi:hypothetical protein
MLSLLVNAQSAKSLNALHQDPDTFPGVDTTAPTAQTSIGDLKWFEVFKDEELQKLVRQRCSRIMISRGSAARAERANLGLARSNQFPVRSRR